ncbi:Hsp70 family protein [Antrihabitans stalactiti]|uniref:Hsp70 protein n=1 Tax=Antrihabitans stalactiti TaxID=2584121 RepID=A0A848KJ10_9NOCA|nr:Hsp70 family protein [Antrihabitans stalactiti]NMN96210.1 hypothetical protein [Antrihabitans stalactiti]
MRSALGISAGTEVVCSALLTTTPNGNQAFEYRVMTADDEANTDLGDLVASSIDLMTTHVHTETIHPAGIAVAYRTKEQTQAIRSAVGSRRRDLHLVPEAAAAIAYLRSTGEVAQNATIATFDLGASGLTINVLDQVDGTVLDSRRTTAVSGSTIDALVAGHLLAEHYARERGERPGNSLLTSRARVAKEHLSTNDAVTVDHVAGRPLQLTRVDFEAIIGDQLDDAAEFAKSVFDDAERRPEIVAVIGGGANIPAVRTRLADALEIPILGVDEPEAVIAKGAALLADSAGPLSFPVVSVGADAAAGTFSKVAGALIGAFVVVGLIIGYGVQALTPSPDDTSGVSPAVTSGLQTTDSQVAVTSEPAPPIETETGPSFPTYESAQVPTTTARRVDPPVVTTTIVRPPITTTPPPPSTTTTPKKPGPTLRPAPDLPLIPWPEIEKWLPRPPQLGPTDSVTETNATTESSAPESPEPPFAPTPFGLLPH